MWVVVNPSNEKEDRNFELVGTGHPIQYNAGTARKFLGTYQYQKGEFIGHVFEITG
jgi:hypothetical protein